MAHLLEGKCAAPKDPRPLVTTYFCVYNKDHEGSHSWEDTAETRVKKFRGQGLLLPPRGAAEHLRDDAPFLVCSDCGRKSWASKVGDGCQMAQPGGTQCPGTFEDRS